MKEIEDLAKRVGRDWRGLASFPEVATRALESFAYDLTKPQLDVALARRLRKGPLPDQVNLHNTFGQPPVTLFNNGRFVIDLYFWLTFDTSIHSHGFRGAFRVLHGTSLHEVFRVKTIRRIASDVALVDLGTPEASLLNGGDVRAIQPGQDLTHRVIHLENPTITLCVKTIDEPAIAQWKYFPNGLAIQMRHLEPDLIKRLYYFQYLVAQDANHAARFLDEVLRDLDRSTCMNLYGAVASGDYGISRQAALLFATRLRRLHGRADWFKRYEAIDALLMDDVHFEESNSPTCRLVAHFINTGRDVRTVLGGIPRSRMERILADLVDLEGVFGHEVSLAERAEIKRLVSDPGRKIPAPLRAFGQIRKMREFLQSF